MVLVSHNTLKQEVPILNQRRSLGSQVALEQNADIKHRFSVFKTWFLNQYMPDGTQKRLVALHIDTAKPKYRDEYPVNSNPEVPDLRATYLSAILQAPELAVPSESKSHAHMHGNVLDIDILISVAHNLTNSLSLSYHRKGRKITPGSFFNGPTRNRRRPCSMDVGRFAEKQPPDTSQGRANGVIDDLAGVFENLGSGSILYRVGKYPFR